MPRLRNDTFTPFRRLWITKRIFLEVGRLRITHSLLEWLVEEPFAQGHFWMKGRRYRWRGRGIVCDHWLLRRVSLGLIFAFRLGLVLFCFCLWLLVCLFFRLFAYMFVWWLYSGNHDNQSRKNLKMKNVVLTLCLAFEISQDIWICLQTILSTNFHPLSCLFRIILRRPVRLTITLNMLITL